MKIEGARRRDTLGWIARIKSVTGLDRSIAWTVAARGWSSIAGFITVLLVARFLTPIEQGFYYTFGSIVAAQIFFELGLTSVLLHSASHEGAHLYWKDGFLRGLEIPFGRLSTLFQQAVVWYTVASIGLIVCLLPGGYYFFLTHSYGATAVLWQRPWIVLVVGTAINLMMSPVVTLFEGVGLVAEVAALRLRQALASSVAIWIILLLHGGLFASALGVGMQAIVVLIWVFKTKRKAVTDLMKHRPQENARISWREEIWPFQWRIAVSWLSGYFIFQAINPILFMYSGAVEAGRMGMSMTVSTAIAVLGLSWVNTKAAPFGQWIAAGDYRRLDAVFFKSLAQSTVLIMMLYIVFGVAVYLAQSHHIAVSMRVLPIGTLIVLFGANLLNHVVNSQAIYLRSHKREVLMPSALLSGVATLICTRLLAPHYGALGVSIGYLFTSLVFGLLLVTVIFFRSRREWHA